MKKLLLILMTLTVFNTTLVAKKTKVDTTFTFQNFVPSSPDSCHLSGRRSLLLRNRRQKLDRVVQLRNVLQRSLQSLLRRLHPLC